MATRGSRLPLRAAARLLPQLRARARASCPPQSELVALCDQDDRWDPDKLGSCALRSATASWPTRTCGSSRPTGASGARRSGRAVATATTTSPLRDREHDHGRLSTLSPRVARPRAPVPRHPRLSVPRSLDRGLGAGAGPVAYVDRPLYDYVQHPGAVFGDVTAPGRERPSTAQASASLVTSAPVLLRLPGGEAQAQERCCGARPGSPPLNVARSTLHRRERSSVALMWLLARPLRVAARPQRDARDRDRARAGDPVERAARFRRGTGGAGWACR